MENQLSNVRIGNPTSSEIVALTSFGKPGSRDMTPEELAEHRLKNPKSKATKIQTPPGPGAPFFKYVKDCRIERMYKKSLDPSGDIFAFAWGKLCEKIVHEKLGLGYVFQSQDTIEHKTIKGWYGTPDGFKNPVFLKVKDHWILHTTDIVTEIKCPISIGGFDDLVRPLYEFDGFNVTGKREISGNEAIQQIRKASKEGEKYYWQIVSNACITGATKAELIVYMPYFDELDEIYAYNNDLAEPFYIVGRRLPHELPFLHRDIGIDNINIIAFDVPQEDKDFLTSRVEMCIKLIDAKEDAHNECE